MKYTDQEIIDKFSKVDFDKTGLKKQAILTRVTQACAQRRTIMFKKYRPIVATAVVVLVAIPVVMLTSGKKEETKAPVTQETSLPSKVSSLSTQTTITPSVPSDAVVPTAMVEGRASRAFLADGSSLASGYNTSAKRIAGAAGSAGYSYKGLARGSSFPTRTRVVAPVYIQEAGSVSKDSKGYEENGFKKAVLDPLSTFSADVDTASYNMVKEQITRGWPIQKDGVRTEAFINNFAYNYPAPQGKDPVNIVIEYANSPWDEHSQLVKIGVKARELDRAQLPRSNLVFLIDVSGSMRGDNRLPLVKQAFKMLLNQLNEKDVVSIVTYASGVDVKLDGVKVKDKKKIIETIDALRAGGSTSGEEGLKRAYEVAKKNFLRKGNNRIIIASDGDFNVGNSTPAALEKQVSEAKESGVFISALGFGMGNYRDHMMETIADKGNGNYAYINDLKAAQKALVREFGATMFTVAKDVKFQVEFNPTLVEEYRLIGYEKRLLNDEDFNDDTKDAGEMGSGHTVTVFYEIRPKGAEGKAHLDIDALKYTRTEHDDTNEVLTVKMRYKEPQGDESKLLNKVLFKGELKPFEKMSNDFRFATAAAAFGQLLRDGKFLNGFTAKQIADIAAHAKGEDDGGDRAEFVQLIRTYADTPQVQPKEDFVPERGHPVPVRPICRGRGCMVRG